MKKFIPYIIIVILTIAGTWLGVALKKEANQKKYLAEQLELKSQELIVVKEDFDSVAYQLGQMEAFIRVLEIEEEAARRSAKRYRSQRNKLRNEKNRTGFSIEPDSITTILQRAASARRERIY